MNSNQLLNNYKEIRKKLYTDVYESELKRFNIDLNKWNENPYTKLKSYYYIEIGAFLTYFLLKTKVTPNSITLVYANLGILAALLMLPGNTTTTLLAIFIWFSKAIPDWIDGHIARVKNMTSAIGGMLDSWGAHVNTLSFQVGICFFLAQNSSSEIYLFLALAIVYSSAINFRTYMYQHINKSIEPLSDQALVNKKNNYERSFINTVKKLASKLRYDGRSRYTDLVLLIVLLEVFFDTNFLSIVFVWMWSILSIIYSIYSLVSTLKK